MTNFRLIINYIIDIFLISYTIYYFSFFLLGLFTKKSKKTKKALSQFAIIVPAHNEEKVIAKLLNNLQKLNYPSHLYDIYVIADNCQDQTTNIVKNFPVNLLERNNPYEKGKGFALQYAFKKLGFLKGNNKYDAAIVFDADNLVEDNFLKVMNNRLIAGEKIIQAYIDSKNPTDNWVTSTFSMMFWINDRFNLLARYNVGLSAVLMGTGMCISSQVLEEIGWHTETLTEDLEYSVQALTQGIKTTFAKETKIYNEKPLSFKASCRQRLRWARGQISVTLKYVPKLLKKGVKQKSPAIFDGGIRLFQQPFIMFYSLITILRILFPANFYSPLFNLILENLTILAFVLPIMPYLIPSSIFFLDNLPFKAVKYIPFFPIFMYSWVFILYWGLLTLNKKNWLPTTHTRGISCEELKEKTT